MTKEQKSQSIEALASVLSSNNNIYLADTSGMNARQTSEFRRYCHNSQARIQVVKNTLLCKAMEKQGEKWFPLFDSLKGNISVITAEVNNVPAKIIKGFRKKNNSEKPFFKAAYVEKSFYIGSHQLDILVNIKSKEELIGDVISLLQFPLKNIVSALQSGGYKISGLLQSLSKK
ncbi:50S ribosomal protein L10 [Bacteroidetes bacterium endosymbiont of Geopemphigus sp.]|uniref:50S ribosomal protein L10 n=1 Tax=Bacteroidetes bacterium endosymbiont of Geopemphigus sp. TaxID=2047937 RepID=UPI000CD31DAA|nr:50S ribosomal protein L10 [Bacteroidetes bacterium endosymbiont of Geopemphigus sp.]